jgi:hypothetical protein
MNREADEKLRQAVRDWLDTSPAASACLLVGQPDDGPPVWLLVGTEEQIRVNVSGYRQLKAERDTLAAELLELRNTIT